MDSGVTERAPDDVSDIDVVWTDYRERPALPHPVEAKSGAWKLDDLFKFFGWTRYLGLEPGQFAYANPPEKLEKVERVAESMGVELLRVDHSTSSPASRSALAETRPAGPAPTTQTVFTLGPPSLRAGLPNAV